MEHLPALLENLGIENVELARLHIGGCSLERHVKCYNTQEAAYEFYHSKAGENRWVKSEEMVPMQHALEMGEWDIITLQQVSGQSGKYESYVPHLDRLIAIVSKAQPQAELVWHMTWSYAKESTHGDFPNYDRDQQKMYDAITDCVHRLKKEFKAIKNIIPSGTAIQSLRLSEINNAPKDFTRDGYHMDLGAGRYALACTWYETLIKPYTHRSMMGNGLRLDLGDVKVTDATAPYIQKAAKKASKKPFKVQTIK
jgi:beta-glucosidase